MTISGIVVCSTCGQKIRLRHQVGLFYPVKVNIPCNKCGKILKGEVTKEGDTAFLFPNDKVIMGFAEADQIISISTELPILKKETNVNGPSFSPFLALSPKIFTFLEIQAYTANLREFQSIYDKKLSQLINSFELFENKNWHHYLNHLKNNFDDDIDIIETFEHSSIMLVSLNEIIFRLLRTDYYVYNFDDKLFNKLYSTNIGKIEELRNLKNAIEQYIDLEEEFIKGVKLLEIFLKNVHSFLPIILLSYKNDFEKLYGDDLDITTFDFVELKHLFIEQFEYLSRISSLYFGLINLTNNGDFNNFGSINDCNNLSTYCAKDNGIKKEIIKKEPTLNSYFLNTLNSQIRNGIGHLKTKYDPKTQIIRYYPYKTPDKKDDYKEIYLIDFAFLVYQQTLKTHNSLRIITKLFDLIK